MTEGMIPLRTKIDTENAERVRSLYALASRIRVTDALVWLISRGVMLIVFLWLARAALQIALNIVGLMNHA